MKKFRFSLDKVLNYRNQVERNIRSEHAVIQRSVARAEAEIEAREAEFRSCAAEYEVLKREGLTLNRMRTFEDYLETQGREIARARIALLRLQQEEEQKRAEVLKAKQETSKLSRLKEKRKATYDQEARKEEEQNLEEFVVNRMRTD